ncbi:MAG: tol-pal system protein YbgF [Myxococcales bacterium]|nr:tol-pal system protein YbgF [Myxococcales bacterium]
MKIKRRRARASLALIALAAASTGGCVALQEDHLALKQRVDSLEARVDKDEADLRAAAGRQADQQAIVDELRATTREVRGLVAGQAGGAVALNQEATLIEQRFVDDQIREEENGVKLASIEISLDRLRGRIEEVATGKRPQLARTEDPRTEAATSALALYSEALKLFQRREYRASREKLEEFLRRYARGAYADNAQYWIGETYYNEGDYERAALAFNEVTKRYPDGDKASFALMRLGFSFFELKNYDLARAALLRVIEQYPEEKQALIAKRKLLLIRALEDEERTKKSAQ